MKKQLIILFLIFTTIQYGYSQRNFFTSNKVIMKCDSSILHFDAQSSLNLNISLFWSVGNKSIKFNNHYYYPFIFSTDSPTDTIGYIRYIDHKIYIITKEPNHKRKEQLLFSFSNRIRAWQVHNIYGFEDKMSLKRTYYSSQYNESIYVIHFNAFPTKMTLGDLHVGLRNGIIKAVFYTHYQPLNLNCILEETR